MQPRLRLNFLVREGGVQLTSKSTEAHIRSLARSGRLVLFEPELAPGETYRRRLWLHPALAKWVANQSHDISQQRYFEAVRAFLKTFVTGDDFDNDNVLKKLTTKFGDWYEFRVACDPHHRIIGGLLRTGEFIALAHETRRNLDDKGFAPMISRASRLWNSMSFENRPLAGERSSLLEDFDDDED